MKIALGQIASGSDKAENLAVIEQLVVDAAKAGAAVIVFPEYAAWNEARLSQNFVDNAEAIDGPLAQKISELARQHHISIVYGFNEHIDGQDKVYNTIAVFDAQGELASEYRKMHLYDAFGSQESDWMVPGATDQLAQFEIDGVKLGVLTCYDMRFPEAARLHADAGTDVLLYPASWIPGPRKEDHWRTLARARAIENTLFVVAVGQAPRIGVGGSLAVDPSGVIKTELAERVELGFVEIDVERITQVRETNPSLVNRRFGVVAK